MVIVGMVETCGCQTLAVWIVLEIGHRLASIKLTIDEFRIPPEISAGPLTAIGTAPDQSPLHDGQESLHVRTKIALALEDLIRVVDCLARVACHHQEYQVTVDIRQVLRSSHPQVLNDKSSSILNGLE